MVKKDKDGKHKMARAMRQEQHSLQMNRTHAKTKQPATSAHDGNFCNWANKIQLFNCSILIFRNIDLLNFVNSNNSRKIEMFILSPLVYIYMFHYGTVAVRALRMHCTCTHKVAHRLFPHINLQFKDQHQMDDYASPPHSTIPGKTHTLATLSVR